MKVKTGFTFNNLLGIVIVITVIFLVIVMASLGNLDSYLLSYPRLADPVAPRTIPYHIKGITVFITKEDNIKLGWLSWTEFYLQIFLAIVLLFAIKWPPPALIKSFRNKDEDEDNSFLKNEPIDHP